MTVHYFFSRGFFATLLLVVALAGVVSWGAVTMHHDLGRTTPMTSSTSGCVGQLTSATCLDVHLGTLEQISQSLPQEVLILFTFFLVVLFFGMRRRSSISPSQLARWRKRLLDTFAYNFRTALRAWLTMHEKRDPLAILLVQDRMLSG